MRILLIIFLVSGCTYTSENFLGASGDVKAPVGNLQTVKVDNGKVEGYRCMGAALFRKHPGNCQSNIDEILKAYTTTAGSLAP
ncbi:MAG TPA: hypothetical protein VI489_05050 [Candidatus Brocadiaceae bacterium]